MQDHNLSQLEHDLTLRDSEFRSGSAYHIFGIWEGCGRNVVQSRYYEMVKVHHPDRYGGNTSSKLKKLSQSIFLQIQDAYQTLIKLEDGPQRVADPSSERARALSSLQANKATTIEPIQEESSQYKRMRRTGINERLSNKAIFEAVTISERDASTLEEDSMPEEERRAKLAKLARTVRHKPTRPPISQVLSQGNFDSLEEDSALSIKERRDKLAGLSSRPKPSPAAFTRNENPPTIPGLHADSTPLADTASSGNIRGLSLQDARRQASLSSHQEDFSRGVNEMRESRYKYAFELVGNAHKEQPDNLRYKTYYAYLMFMVDGEKKSQAETLLKEVLDREDKQTAADAHLFIGYILKVSDSMRDRQRSYQHFRKALELNPSNHEATREVRLYELRNKEESSPSIQDDVGGFFKRLFKK